MRPLCACGCQRRVKHVRNRWATPECIPHEVRAENGRRNRRTYAYRKRRLKFDEDLAELQGRIVTKEQLLAVLRRVYDRGYNTGINAPKWKQAKPEVAA